MIWDLEVGKNPECKLNSNTFLNWNHIEKPVPCGFHSSSKASFTEVISHDYLID